VAATPRELLDRFQQAMLDFSPDSLADLFADEAIYEFVFWTPHRGPSQRMTGVRRSAPASGRHGGRSPSRR
jgi:hypothetical protein